MIEASESYIYNPSSNDSDGDEAGYTKKGQLKKSVIEEDDKYFKCIPPPNPILPKYMNLYNFEPPKCPLKHVNFM